MLLVQLFWEKKVSETSHLVLALTRNRRNLTFLAKLKLKNYTIKSSQNTQGFYFVAHKALFQPYLRFQGNVEIFLKAIYYLWKERECLHTFHTRRAIFQICKLIWLWKKERKKERKKNNILNQNVKINCLFVTGKRDKTISKYFFMNSWLFWLKNFFWSVQFKTLNFGFSISSIDHAVKSSRQYYPQKFVKKYFPQF